MKNLELAARALLWLKEDEWFDACGCPGFQSVALAMEEGATASTSRSSFCATTAVFRPEEGGEEGEEEGEEAVAKAFICTRQALETASVIMATAAARSWPFTAPATCTASPPPAPPPPVSVAPVTGSADSAESSSTRTRPVSPSTAMTVP
mmetsp:Transcript_40886/g.80242  ORF Transcript_40886/g.80242 Transcript_40886/m.80242 type:complete len:150 (+) Transcript_40886:1176-1625(+)